MFEAYKIGVVVALENNISRGLMMIQADLVKTDLKAQQLHKTLSSIKNLALGGAILTIPAVLGFKGLEAGYESAKKYEQVFASFKALNLGDAVNHQADLFARGSKTIGVSATDMMVTMRDLHTTLAQFPLARQLAPQVAQMKYANEAVFGEKGMKFDDSQFRAMEKIIEMKGGFKNAATFMAQASMMQQVVSGTGGMVQPSDFLKFIKTAGVSGRLLNNEMFYYTMEPLIQEMSGNRVGTGTMSAYNNLAQGRSTVRAAKEMMRMGLLDPGMVEYDKIGQVKQIKPGAIKNFNEFTSNPYEWMKDTLIPAMKAKGITSQDGMLNEMGVIFGNRTGSSLFSLMLLQMDKIEKNMAISHNAMTTDQLITMASKTPKGAEMALGAAWDSVKTAFGETVIPVVVPMLLKFASALRDFGAWTARHPVQFQWLTNGFIALAAAMAFSGSVLLLAAAFKTLGLLFGIGGGLTGVVAGLGTAFAGLSAVLIPLLALLAPIGVAYAEKNQWVKSLEKNHQWVGDGLLSARDWMRDKLSPAFKHQTGQMVQVNSAINMDGRKIASAVTKHQEKAMNTNDSSAQGFDFSQSFAGPGLGFAFQ